MMARKGKSRGGSGRTSPDQPKMSKKQRQLLKQKEQKKLQEQLEEDAKWADNDKRRKKKVQRQQEKEEKAMQKKLRKQESRQLLEEENKRIQNQIHKPTAKNQEGNLKKSRAEVEAAKRKKEEEMQLRAEEAERQRQRLSVQDFHDFNPNHIEEDEVHATGIDAAVSLSRMMSGEVTPRYEYGFGEFRGEHMSKVKRANPRFSAKQLESALSKQWRDSPMNPDNHT
eukprot:m.24089 g.24089  ORF g.24089 m.24089 type:complete len:226 (+) comp9072_c0_seq1:183-860(+)